MKKVVSLLLSAIIMFNLLPVSAFAAVTPLWDWSGYTPVSSQADLQAIADDLDGKYYLTGNIALSGEFSTVGSSSQPFTGVLDGNGYTISNLVISYSGTAIGQRTGLFSTNNGIIRNITFDNATLNITSNLQSATTPGFIHVGIVAGYNNGDIINCIIKDTCAVNATIYSNGVVGGITGTNKGTVRLCTNNAPVTVSGGTSTSYQTSVDIGGIAGNGGNICFCVNAGAVTSTGIGNDYGTAGNAGGISGCSDGTISDCINTGTVTMSTADWCVPAANVGGIVGKATGDVTRCETKTQITATSGEVNIGGIAGYIENASIYHCHNDSTLYASARNNNAGGYKTATMGGIAGLAYGAEISNSYASGNSNMYVEQSTTGFDGIDAGFIAGRIVDNSSVSCCYTMESTYRNNSGVTSRDYLGNVAGSIEESTITNVYYNSTGDISGDIGSNYDSTVTNIKGYGVDGLQIQSSYVGFDFDNIWTLDPDVYVYPSFITPVTHSHSKTAIQAVSAECGETGRIAAYYCAGCDTYFRDTSNKRAVTEDELNVVVHTNIEKQIVNITSPSCTQPGYTEITTYCADCGTTISVEYIYPSATGHTEEIITGYRATCTSAGLSDGVKCTVCGNILTPQTELPMADHSFTQYINNSDVTCTEDGTKTAKCDNCDATNTVTAEKLGHSFTNYISNGDATCSAKGTETATCDRCSATDTREDADTVGDHVFKNYTFNGDGTKTAKCENCDATQTINVDILVTGPCGEESYFTIYEDGRMFITGSGGVEYSTGWDNYRSFVTYLDIADTIDFTGGIATGSFTDFTNLEKVIYSRSLISLHDTVGNYLFADSPLLKTAGPFGSGCNIEMKWDSYITYYTFERSTIESVTIPQGITTIDYYAFSDCDNLTEVILPDGVTTIGVNAFANCDNLNKLIIPSSATAIAEGGIYDNSPLLKTAGPAGSGSNVEFGWTESIPDYAFTSTYLEKVTIPATVTSIGEFAFTGADSLTDIYYGGSKLQFESAFTGQLPAGTTVHYGMYDVTVATTENGTATTDKSVVSPGETVTITAEGEQCFVLDKTYVNGTEISSSTFVVNSDSTVKVTFAESHTRVIDEKVEPGCITTGLTQGSHCSRCDKVLVAQTEISALGHSFTDYISDDDATCTANGHETAVCDRCDRTDTREIPDSKADHLFINYKIDKEASCTEGGTKTAKCENCSATDTLEIDVLAHTTETIPAIDATCLVEGWTEGERCTVCGEITLMPCQIDPTGHSPAQAVTENETAATCYQEGSFDLVVYCTNDNCDMENNQLSCETNLIEKIDHTPNMDSATCTTDKICIVEGCGRILESATGHTGGEIVQENHFTAENCKQQSSYDNVVYCIGCETELSRNTIYTGYGDHNPVILKGTDATCTQPGLTDSTYCSVCHTVLLPQEEIPAVGHSYETITVSATCLSNGYTRYTCAVCGDTYDGNIVQATGHRYNSVVTEPDCENRGYTTYTCNVCDHSYVADYVGASGHSYSGVTCTACGTAHPNAANFEGKVISILGDSISTFAGYIPAADGFNLEHYARYPQDNLLTDVNETWWMQLLTSLNAKLGINESWRSTEVGNIYDVEVNSGYEGTKACMASTTRIQNLGANGTPDVILFYGGANDITQRRTIGTFDSDTAPTEVDLTSVKWDTVAEAYIAAIMRMQYYYPEAEIIAMLPTYHSNNADDVIEKYNSVFAAICEHYGVTYIDMRYCGITTDDLPDGSHPDAEGMDYITDAVLEVLLENCELVSGEHIVHSVNHALTGVKASLGYYKGISNGASFTETIYGKNLTVSVTMGGTDITASCYTDGMISINKVTGDLIITATGEDEPTYVEHLQQLPADVCSGMNLWAELTPETGYFKGETWTNSYTSVTIPINEGDRIWATSFQISGTNGGSKNGSRITFFDTNGFLLTMSPDETYAEFVEKGYITVPDSAVAVNIPMRNNSAENEIYILNREHNYDYSVISDPQCDQPGIGMYECTSCEEHYTEEIKALGHDYEATVTAPTCTEQGYTTYTCDCGHSYTDDYIAPMGHTGGNAVVENQITATCTTAGSYDSVTYCTVCGEKISIIHTETVPVGHTEQQIPAVPASCEATGLTAGVECSVCGVILTTQEETPATGHSYDYTVTSAPHCDQPGIGMYDCANCEEHYTVEIRAVGHTPSDPVTENRTAPECEKSGSYDTVIYCAVCDNVISKTQTVIAPTGHSEQVIPAVDPTCEIPGLIQGTECSTCGKIITPQQHVSATGHSYTAVVTSQPTCTTSGEKTFICSNDISHTYTETIPATGHKYEPIVTQPTCLEEGFTIFICTDCNDSYIGEEIISPSGHKFGGYSRYNPFVQYSECDYCGEKVIKENNNIVYRVAGNTRYYTAFEIADFTKEMFGVEKFETVIIASGKVFADALAGTYLANIKEAPILLASGSEKNNMLLKEYIDTNLVPNGKVYILGSDAAIPYTLDALLSDYNIERLAGKTRYDTNIEILLEAGITNEEIMVCTALDFADSLSASAVGKPILLVDSNRNSLRTSQKEYLAKLNTSKFYIIGSENAVSEKLVEEIRTYGETERVSGSTRYKTSVAIAKRFFTDTNAAVIACGKDFPDGLCGGVLASSMGAPIILSDKGNATVNIPKEYVRSIDAVSGVVLGSEVRIDDTIAKTIFDIEKIELWD